MKKIDSDTWGNTPASRLLVILLEEQDDPRLLSKVSRTLHQYFNSMQQVQKMDSEWKVFFAKMTMDHYNHSVLETTWPPKVASVVRNVIRAKYRRMLREAKAGV